VLKLPVPVTVAAHWLVWPGERLLGLHVTLIAVMVDADEFGETFETILPLHPVIQRMPEKIRQNTTLRTITILPPFIESDKRAISQRIYLAITCYRRRFSDAKALPLHMCNEFMLLK